MSLLFNWLRRAIARIGVRVNLRNWEAPRRRYRLPFRVVCGILTLVVKNAPSAMTSEASENESQPETARQQAAQVVMRLEELLLHVDAAGERTDRKPPPERIKALISDTLSLAEAISTGACTVGQPRMAHNIIAVVETLDELDHHSLASEFTGVLRWLSIRGIAADNCSLGRSRLSPGKH